MFLVIYSFFFANYFSIYPPLFIFLLHCLFFYYSLIYILDTNFLLVLCSKISSNQCFGLLTLWDFFVVESFNFILYPNLSIFSNIIRPSVFLKNYSYTFRSYTYFLLYTFSKCFRSFFFSHLFFNAYKIYFYVQYQIII